MRKKFEQSNDDCSFALARKTFEEKALLHLHEALDGTMTMVQYVNIARAIGKELGDAARNTYVWEFANVCDDVIGQQLRLLKRLAFLAKSEALEFKSDNKLETIPEAAQRLLPMLHEQIEIPFPERQELRDGIREIIVSDMQRHKAWPAMEKISEIINEPAVEIINGKMETFAEAVARLNDKVFENNHEYSDELVKLFDTLVGLGLINYLETEEAGTALKG